MSDTLASLALLVMLWMVIDIRNAVRQLARRAS